MEAFAFIGMFVVALFIITALNAFSKFIQTIVVGKYKIKFLCNHEYVPHCKFYCGKHGSDYIFKCRKCGKEKQINSFKDGNNEQVF